MNLRRALGIAACLLPFAAIPAVAQAPWPTSPQQPQQQQQPMQAPWPMAPQAQPQEPPCVTDFGKLRDDAAKKAQAIQKAGERKASPQEACKLFTVFSAAEAKMLKFAQDNAVSCGVPPQIITQIKQAHAKTGEIRTRVCQAAAQPQRPAGPTLSDALGAPVPDSSNIKTGRGTYDTLTGTPLGNR